MGIYDDQPIVSGPDGGPKKALLVEGRVQLRTLYSDKAPLTQTKVTPMLELTVGASVIDRPGLDLVAVLDVSSSMGNQKTAVVSKLDKMKTALLFVIRKLSSIDRLSIVTFAEKPEGRFPLTQITDTSKAEIERTVEGLATSRGTNITDGLRTALEVLNSRTLRIGRTMGIMLMSDGEQNRGGDAGRFRIGNVPVYTFGFGQGIDFTVLQAVANNSLGGVFSFVEDTKDQNGTRNLSKAFSQCLAGLLTVVVQDLKLTVTQVPDESTVDKVTAGSYQKNEDVPGSVTIEFGDLYSRERRNITVELTLPAIDEDRGAEILQIAYSYSFQRRQPKYFVALDADRSRAYKDQEDLPEVAVEGARQRIASLMKDARLMADEDRLEDAQYKLGDAENHLRDFDESNPIIQMLISELEQMRNLMTKEFYRQKGRPFALSSETSHARQRFATRGDAENVRSYATPRMDKYLEQAKTFEESRPLPSSDEDVEKELAKNPLASVAGPLSHYIKTAIEAFQGIEKIISAAR